MTYAFRKDGTLWTWGRNSSGVLGDNTTGVRAYPSMIMDNIIAVSIGMFAESFTVLRRDGTLWTWGSNSRGRLGSGEHERHRNLPMAILDNVVQLCRSGTSALRSDGSLWSWGAQFRDGVEFSRSYIPIMVEQNFDGPQQSRITLFDGTEMEW